MHHHTTHLPFDTLLLAVNVFAVVMLLIVVAICCSSQRICRHDEPTFLPRSEAWWRARTGRGDGRANIHHPISNP